jgi:hypothetical protein
LLAACRKEERAEPASVPPDALQKAATLIRGFGEDYHEKQLEEAHMFPTLRARIRAPKRRETG